MPPEPKKHYIVDISDKTAKIFDILKEEKGKRFLQPGCKKFKIIPVPDKDFLFHGRPFYLKISRGSFKGKISLSRVPMPTKLMSKSTQGMPTPAKFLPIEAKFCGCPHNGC